MVSKPLLNVKRCSGNRKQWTCPNHKLSSEIGENLKQKQAPGGAEMAALACLYQKSADENILQSWFSLTHAVATNLSFLVSASLSNQRPNFLLCRQMVTLVSLLRCFFFSLKLGLLHSPVLPYIKESITPVLFFQLPLWSAFINFNSVCH